MSSVNPSDLVGNKKVNTLILDAGPLITQTASVLKNYANNFYTTPGVHAELKDDFAKSQLVLWDDNLKIRQPKQSSIKRVADFAKLTGDYGVLSMNDIHIIALAYELECEENKGDWRLRKFPGEVKEFHKSKKVVEQEEKVDSAEVKNDEKKEEKEDEWVIPNSKGSVNDVDVPQSKEGGEVQKKQRRRGGKKQREKREAAAAAAAEATASLTAEPETETETSTTDQLEEQYDEDDDDGEWITPDNLIEKMMEDTNEQISEMNNESSESKTIVKVAISTGDFACQNVSLQLGLNLMNAMSGKRIKRVRNYMLRCHACFRLTPLPKDDTPKHFCSYCGGATLLRCAVSIDSKTGEITPHLKKNFEWHTRGDRYSLASPLSKNSQKKYGKSGYQHNPSKKQDVVLLNEDQKEYQQAIKNEKWQRRQNEKLLEEWIGGGSADNYISPFNSTQRGHSSVKIGKGRYVNSVKQARR